MSNEAQRIGGFNHPMLSQATYIYIYIVLYSYTPDIV